MVDSVGMRMRLRLAEREPWSGDCGGGGLGACLEAPCLYPHLLFSGGACTWSAVPSETVSGTVIKTFICVCAACVAWGVRTPINARRAVSQNRRIEGWLDLV